MNPLYEGLMFLSGIPYDRIVVSLIDVGYSRYYLQALF